MPLLNDAVNVKMGAVQVAAVYKAGVKVWPKPVVNTLSASLRVMDPSEHPTRSGVWVYVGTSYSGTTPDLYKYYSSTNGGAWTYLYEANESAAIFETSYSSTVAIKVETFAGSTGLNTAITNTVTTGARPITYVQREWYGYAADAKSYRGNNAQRTDASGLANCYYGMTTLSGGSTWGEQKSLARFDIPGEIRNCVSVDSVQIKWYNLHHNNNSGGQVSMVAHHNTTLGTTFGGSTGALLLDTGASVLWPAPKPGWINGQAPPNEWYHVGFLHSSGRPTIYEEIRVQGLQGFGLIRPVGISGNAGYGYAARNPRLYIKYTVAV